MKAAVLIAEDSDDTRELLAELLMREGYHSIMARNGREALSRMSTVVPDVVVTDFQMPELGGAKLIAEMAASPPLAKVPVILLSASPRTMVEAELARENAVPTRVMAKPVNLRELLDLLASLVGNRS